MSLDSNTVHIWTSSLDISEEQATRFLPTLSEKEREQAVRFRFAIHRLRYIASHYILRHVIAHYINIEPINIQYAYTEEGKPMLATQHHPHIEFNLSHSDNVAVYAIGQDHPLGVDIEKIKSDYNKDIVKRFYSPSEQEMFNSLADDEKQDAFFALWTRKEALMKATGNGLSPSFSDFSVVNNDNKLIKLDDQDWQLIPLRVKNDFQAALACHPSIRKIDYEDADRFLTL